MNNAIRYKGHVKIITDKDKKYVLKKNKKRNKQVYNYLLSRNFNNFPNVYSSIDDDIETTEYIDDLLIDNKNKLDDLVFLTTLLHNKTVHYRTVDLDQIKKIYEDMKERFSYLYSYYYSIMKMIGEDIYMSPSNYYFILNISKLFKVLEFGNMMIEDWYKHISSKKTLRYVLAHHNLSSSHLIKNSNPYLISWDKADFDFVSEDLVSIFENNYLNIQIDTILGLYNSKNPLNDYEYELFLAKICLIKQINFNDIESKRIVEIVKLNHYVSEVYSYIILKQNSTDSNKKAYHK